MMEVLHSGCSTAGGEGDVKEVVYLEGENKLQGNRASLRLQHGRW